MVLPMWAFWVALAGMGVGLVGVALPVIPGVGLIWLVALVYALCEGFATVDPLTFAALTLLGALGVTTDVWVSQASAKLGGASLRSLLIGMGGGALGALVGAIFFGAGALPGAIIGTLLGVVLAEWQRRQNWREALESGGLWLLGCALSGAVQFLIGLLMIGIFVWQALKGA